MVLIFIDHFVVIVCGGLATIVGYFLAQFPAIELHIISFGMLIVVNDRKAFQLAVNIVTHRKKQQNRVRDYAWI